MEKAEKTKKSWQERKTQIKYKWAMPFIFVEWFCERMSYLLSRWAFIEILQYAGQLAIILALISYAKGCTQREMQAENQRKAKHYQAWQVINTAQGKTGSGGRIDALQDLNSDGISLVGVDVSKAWLPSVNLENANLYLANFAGATLDKADLSAANLLSADLSHAALVEANLAGASLVWAKLNEANLPNANLSGADFHEADLSFARLDGANLKGIKNWKNIRSLSYVAIEGVKNAPDGFVKLARQQGAYEKQIKDHQKWLEFIREKKKELEARTSK